MAQEPLKQKLGSRSSSGAADWSPSATTSKLRDSCHACARSKVKCSKDKPTCTRCAKRGTSCQYLATKRPGRKYENRANNQKAAAKEPSSTTKTADFRIQSQPLLPQLTTTSTTLYTPYSSAFDSLSSSYTSIEPLEMSSTLPSLGSEFDEFFSSPVDFSLPSTTEFDILDPPSSDIYSYTGSSSPSPGSRSSISSRAGSVTSFSPEDTIYLFGEHPKSPRSPITPSSTPGRSTPKNTEKKCHKLSAVNNPGCCLVQSLDIMKRLSIGDPMDCTASHLQFDVSSRTPPNIQSVISQNEQTVEEISKMLQCPCSKNSFLLTMMSLIVFKVLNLYAAAAQASTTTEDTASPFPMDLDYKPVTFTHRDELDDPDFSRMSAQRVLGELHRVQRLLNQLSPVLRACGRDLRRCSDADSFLDGVITSSPFSPAVLDQLESELRKYVRGLSLEIIELLRRD